MNFMKYFNYKSLLEDKVFYILLFISVFFISFVFVYKGYNSLPINIWETIRQAFVVNFITLFVFRQIGRKFFTLFYWILLLMGIIYLPYVVDYGYGLSYAFTVLMESNPNEALGFISIISTKAYILDVILLLLGIVTTIYCFKNKSNNTFWKSKVITILSIIIVIALALQGLIAGSKITWKGINLLRYSKLTYLKVLGHYMDARAQHKYLTEFSNDKATWQIQSQKTLKYKNYILIIGESASADYMSLFGYPYPNTHFLDTVKCSINTKFYSPGFATMQSLQRFLFERLAYGKFQLHNNIISLAHKRGLHTYWISTQGTCDDADGAISHLGKNCDKYKFINDATFTWKHDTAVLPVLKTFIDDKYRLDSTKRFIVIHINGSHEPFEWRLEHPLYINHYNKNVSQYLQTLDQTDKLLHSIYDILKNSHQSFSLIYFSDHGLSANKEQKLIHQNLSTSYHIPFVRINSDDSTRVICQEAKSGYNFLRGFAGWLGLRVKDLSPYHFFSGKGDSIIMVNNVFHPVLTVNNTNESVPLTSIKKAPILGK